MSSYELYASGFLKTNWMETLWFRDRAPSVPFDRKHGIQFLPSVLSVVVDDPLVANMMDEQEICPCPCLSFYLHLSRSLLHKKGRLVHWLVPVAHSLRDRGRQGSAASENRDVIQNNI